MGDCLDTDFTVVDCTDLHDYQVVGFSTQQGVCASLGEELVGRGATYTTRIVYGAVGAELIDEDAYGSVCLAALANMRWLQPHDFSLENSVAESRDAALLVGGCQPFGTTAVWGRASDLGPCNDEQGWLSGQFFVAPGAGDDADPETICQQFADEFGGRDPQTYRQPGNPFVASVLRQSGRTQAQFVPFVGVLIQGEEVPFRADAAQAMPLPTEADEHDRFACAARLLPDEP